MSNNNNAMNNSINTPEEIKHINDLISLCKYKYECKEIAFFQFRFNSGFKRNGKDVQIRFYFNSNNNIVEFIKRDLRYDFLERGFKQKKYDSFEEFAVALNKATNKYEYSFGCEQ
jgi:hypothetical protein